MTDVNKFDQLLTEEGLHSKILIIRTGPLHSEAKQQADYS